MHNEDTTHRLDNQKEITSSFRIPFLFHKYDLGMQPRKTQAKMKIQYV